MQYLQIEDILLIHSMVLDETGGLHGVRDRAALASLISLPQQTVFGKELYVTLAEKAAVYARCIIKNHPFLDGNKRTGMLAAAVYLQENGRRCSARKGEIESFALKIAEGKMEIIEIARWFDKKFD